MNEGSASLPTPEVSVDECGMELATRLAENAHDTHQPRKTYAVTVHGQQWHVGVWKHVPAFD